MLGKLLLGLLAAGGLAVGAGVVTASVSTDDAVVTRIVDGDTFDADVAGIPTRIRLLNVDTPETRDPNRDIECLGPEAAARLAAMIPVGSTVSLAYDDERLDRYDRTLAGVYDGEGRLVNAELAREGLGTAVVLDGNDRFHDDVVDAQAEARAARRGLYAPDVACSVPARVDAVTSAVTAAEQDLNVPVDPAGMDRLAARAAGLLRDVDAVRSLFDGPRRGQVWAALSPADGQRLTGALTGAADGARALQARWTSAAATTRERDRLAAEQAERDRVAREEAARADAERAEAPRADEQRRRATAAPPATTAPADTASGGGGCDPNYTPCVPLSDRDLDCGDLSGGPFTVIGTDRHRLDLGGVEGVGCESQG